MSLPGIETHCLSSVAFDPGGRFLIAAGGGWAPKQPKDLHEIVAWNLPNGDLRRRMVDKAKSRIAGLTMSPTGREFITRSTETEATVWNADSLKPVRSIPVEFLCGDVVYSPDGATVVAPASNILQIRRVSDGEIVQTTALAKSHYTSAQAVA